MNKALLPLYVHGGEVLPKISSLAGDIGISSLWKMFLFTLVAILGALYIETRPVNLDYS